MRYPVAWLLTTTPLPDAWRSTPTTPTSPFIEQYVVDLASTMVQQGNPAKGRPSPTALSYEHWATSSRSRSRCSSSPDARPWKRQWI